MLRRPKLENRQAELFQTTRVRADGTQINMLNDVLFSSLRENWTSKRTLFDTGKPISFHRSTAIKDILFQKEKKSKIYMYCTKLSK